MRLQIKTLMLFVFTPILLVMQTVAAAEVADEFISGNTVPIQHTVNNDGVERLEVKVGGKLTRIPLPEDCGGARECLLKVETPESPYDGGFTVLMQKDTQSPACGGKPCPWTSSAIAQDDGVIQIGVDVLKHITPAYLTGEALVRAAKEERKSVEYSADQNVNAAIHSKAPAFNTNVSTGTFINDTSEVDVKVNSCGGNPNCF